MLPNRVKDVASKANPALSSAKKGEKAPRGKTFDQLTLSREEVARLFGSDFAKALPTIQVTRKNAAHLSRAEKDAFVNAVLTLHKSENAAGLTCPLDNRVISDFEVLVNIHAKMMRHRMHTHSMHPEGTERFLPWHRAFLKVFEEQLRRIDPTVSVPYWEWTKHQAVPAWLTDVLPHTFCIQDDNDKWSHPEEEYRDRQVYRSPGTSPIAPGLIETAPTGPALPTRADIRLRMDMNATYRPFTLAIEGAWPPGGHNIVHMWVGGTMSYVLTSPSDPLFWLHHAEIDRLWHIWQLGHPGQHPAFTGNNGLLDPWTYTYNDVRSIYQMGYSYEEETFPLEPPQVVEPVP